MQKKSGFHIKRDRLKMQAKYPRRMGLEGLSIRIRAIYPHRRATGISLCRLDYDMSFALPITSKCSQSLEPRLTAYYFPIQYNITSHLFQIFNKKNKLPLHEIIQNFNKFHLIFPIPENIFQGCRIYCNRLFNSWKLFQKINQKYFYFLIFQQFFSRLRSCN